MNDHVIHRMRSCQLHLWLWITWQSLSLSPPASSETHRLLTSHTVDLSVAKSIAELSFSGWGTIYSLYSFSFHTSWVEEINSCGCWQLFCVYFLERVQTVLVILHSPPLSPSTEQKWICLLTAHYKEYTEYWLLMGYYKPIASCYLLATALGSCKS